MLFKMLTGLGSVIALLIMGGLVYRRERQRLTAKMLAINTPNGIVEERFVRVGGIDQWIQIRGENRNNPVMLILHGGPGWSNSIFTLPLRSWEKHFTVVQWDHRGTGKTLRRNGKPGSGEMSFHGRVSDAIELTEFLHRYLSKDKVILLSESMGTLTGLPLAMLRPDMFSALVVTDLYVDMMRNEALKHQLTLGRVHSVGNIKGMTALQKIGGDPTEWDLHAWNVNMAWAFKTNKPTPNLDRSLLLPLVLFSPIYSLQDVYNLFTGFKHSSAELFDEFRTFDARRLGTYFEVPFFLFQGECDVITLTSLAEEYFAEVEAPVKELSLIKKAGHFAAFTQPEQFLAALLKHVLPAVHAPGLDTIPSPSQPAKLNQR